jgi:hypothetical protein
MQRLNMHQLNRLMFPSALCCLLVLPGARIASAQGAQPASPQTPAGAAAPGNNAPRGGGLYPAYQPDDDTGFVSIFDGKTLKDWDGDPQFWRVENGEIVGESTPEKVVKTGNFLIWRGSRVKDFELKLDFKLTGATGTNSGIQYRSTELPEVGKWVLKGYQADMDLANGLTGNIHEERGRGKGEGHIVLAPRGMFTRVTDGPSYKTIATIADAKLLRGVVNVEGWNTYHIIARGPVIVQILNGQLVAATIDEDAKHFVPAGLLGLQMHEGPPSKVEYKNIRYKKLD